MRSKITKPYIRKKGDKFVLEKKVDGKTKFIATLNPFLLEEIFEASKLAKMKASKVTQEMATAMPEKFSQELLAEPSDEEILANLEELEEEESENESREPI